LIALAVLALAGCSHESEEASDLTIPEVVWVGGEPTGPEWQSEWAAAYLTARTQRVAARAYGDFSDPDLVAALSYDRAWGEASAARDERFDPSSDQRPFFELDGVYAYWGAITRIDEAADGDSAILYTCYAVRDNDGELTPYPTDYEITRHDDGTYAVDRNDGLENADSTYKAAEACTDAKIWVAKWATPIDIDDVGRDTVKMPLPREYYIDLGVITQ